MERGFILVSPQGIGNMDCKTTDLCFDVDIKVNLNYSNCGGTDAPARDKILDDFYWQ